MSNKVFPNLYILPYPMYPVLGLLRYDVFIALRQPLP